MRDLTVTVEGRRVIKDVTFDICRGETVALFGPNGSGKTSLIMALMGMPGYDVEGGAVRLNGLDITGLSLDERARMGVGMAFQRPPAIRGLRLGRMLELFAGKQGGCPAGEGPAELARPLGLEGFLGREVNRGFSGGEIKRTELLQLSVQGPCLLLLDEPDSGVDLESIRLVAGVINSLLQKGARAGAREKAGLIITHTGDILDYVNADRAFVLIRGELRCSGNPRDLLEDIRAKGFEGCVRCLQGT